MDNKRKCLCSAYALQREGVCVSRKRGCCARQSMEGRCLHENQRRRKYLRESGWVGGGQGVGTGRKSLCMAVKERVCLKGTGSRGFVWEDCRGEMRGRMSVGGIEMDAVPAPCCQTGHPVTDALTAPCNPMGLFCPINTVSSNVFFWSWKILTGWGCQGSARAVHPCKWISVASFQNFLEGTGRF